VRQIIGRKIIILKTVAFARWIEKVRGIALTIWAAKHKFQCYDMMPDVKIRL